MHTEWKTSIHRATSGFAFSPHVPELVAFLLVDTSGPDMARLGLTLCICCRLLIVIPVYLSLPTSAHFPHTTCWEDTEPISSHTGLVHLGSMDYLFTLLPPHIPPQGFPLLFFPGKFLKVAHALVIVLLLLFSHLFWVGVSSPSLPVLYQLFPSSSIFMCQTLAI